MTAAALGPRLTATTRIRALHPLPMAIGTATHGTARHAAGAFSSIYGTVIMVPGERVKVMLQTHRGRFKGVVDCTKFVSCAGQPFVFLLTCGAGGLPPAPILSTGPTTRPHTVCRPLRLGARPLSGVRVPSLE